MKIRLPKIRLPKIGLQHLALSLNTHGVANGGFAAAVGAGALHIAADAISHGIIKAPAGVALAVTDIDAMVSAPAAATGVLAAYFGRPVSVASTAPAIPAFDKGARVVRNAPVDPGPPPSGRSGSYNTPASNVRADVRGPSLPTVATSLNVAGKAGGSTPHMATSFEGKIADAIVGFYDTNKGALSTLLASKNVLVVDLVENAATQLIAKNPMLNLVLGGELKALAPQLTTLLGSEEAAGIAALDALLHAEAAKLGG